MFDAHPFWLTFAFFFFLAMARGNATYWIGRGLRRGTAGSRLGRRLDGPALARAARLIERVGAPAVSLSFLTIGVQTAVNASAGVLRMPLRWYLPAVTVGALLWAAVYTTIGMSVLQAWVGGVLADWWIAIALLVLVVLATLAGRRWLRAARPVDLSVAPGTGAPADGTPTAGEGPAEDPRRGRAPGSGADG